MDTFLREATSSPALEDVSNWKHHIRLRPFIFLQSRGTYGQVPWAPCPVVWLLAQLLSPTPSSFQHLLTIQATQVAFHSAVSFRSFKRSPDRVEAWICLSEFKKKNLFSFWKWSDGWVLPSLKANAKQCIWGRWQPHRKDARPAWRSQKSVEEARRRRPKAPTWGCAQQTFCSGLAPATDITPIMCRHQKMLGRFPWWSGGSVVKNPPCSAEDGGSIPGLGRFLRLLCKRRPMHSKEDPAQPKMKNRNKLI